MIFEFFKGNPGFDDDGKSIIENLHGLLANKESSHSKVALCYSMGAYRFLDRWTKLSASDQKKYTAVIWMAPFLGSDRPMGGLGKFLLGNGFIRSAIAKNFYKGISRGFVNRMFTGNELIHVSTDRYIQRLQSAEVWDQVLKYKFEQESGGNLVLSNSSDFPKLLVITAGNDRIVSFEETRMHLERLALKAEFYNIPDAGHGFIFTKSREISLRIGDFLK